MGVDIGFDLIAWKDFVTDIPTNNFVYLTPKICRMSMSFST